MTDATSETSPQPAAPQYAQILPGDPAPTFYQVSTSNPRFAFDTAAGRYILMCFHASASDETGRSAIDTIMAERAMFDDDKFCCFAVSIDPENQALRRREREIAELRGRDKPTIPSTMGEERAANPFLRADDPALAAAVGLPDAPPAEVFGEIRRRKDNFR